MGYEGIGGVVCVVSVLFGFGVGRGRGRGEGGGGVCKDWGGGGCGMRGESCCGHALNVNLPKKEER